MEREALTIRFPADLLVKAKKIKKGNESAIAILYFMAEEYQSQLIHEDY